MMIDSLLLFDGILGLGLVSVATGMLFGRDLFRAIVLFILFGLLLTVAWCRLDAVDIALAEAGIGAGLTGALLLNTWAATGRESGSPIVKSTVHEPSTVIGQPSVPHASRLTLTSTKISAALLLVPWILVAGAMAALVVPLIVATDTPQISIEAALANSGVTNPVTAVLLNFRAYDTLLEVAVLLAAALAVLPLTNLSRKGSHPPRRDHETHKIDSSPTAQIPFPLVSKSNKASALSVGAVLEAFTRILVPVAAIVAAYILWSGTKTPGGAFQSAALLCAIGVLLLVTGWRSPDWTKLRWRVLSAVGLIVFLLVGLSGVWGAGGFLQYPTAWAGNLILLIEFCLTVSLTVILVSLFTSTSPSDAVTDTSSDLVATVGNTSKESG